jgi:hypothetical protein
MAKAKGRGDVVKTTVDLPAALWRRAKIAAMDERSDLRDIIIRALEVYLARAHKEGSR